MFECIYRHEYMWCIRIISIRLPFLTFNNVQLFFIYFFPTARRCWAFAFWANVIIILPKKKKKILKGIEVKKINNGKKKIQEKNIKVKKFWKKKSQEYRLYNSFVLHPFFFISWSLKFPSFSRPALRAFYFKQQVFFLVINQKKSSVKIMVKYSWYE